jgi:hypothetical protein
VYQECEVLCLAHTLLDDSRVGSQAILIRSGSETTGRTYPSRHRFGYVSSGRTCGVSSGHGPFRGIFCGSLLGLADYVVWPHLPRKYYWSAPLLLVLLVVSLIHLLLLPLLTLALLRPRFPLLPSPSLGLLCHFHFPVPLRRLPRRRCPRPIPSCYPTLPLLVHGGLVRSRSQVQQLTASGGCNG